MFDHSPPSLSGDPCSVALSFFSLCYYTLSPFIGRRKRVDVRPLYLHTPGRRRLFFNVNFVLFCSLAFCILIRSVTYYASVRLEKGGRLVVLGVGDPPRTWAFGAWQVTYCLYIFLPYTCSFLFSVPYPYSTNSTYMLLLSLVVCLPLSLLSHAFSVSLLSLLFSGWVSYVCGNMSLSLSLLYTCASLCLSLSLSLYQLFCKL